MSPARQSRSPANRSRRGTHRVNSPDRGRNQPWPSDQDWRVISVATAVSKSGCQGASRSVAPAAAASAPSAPSAARAANSIACSSSSSSGWHAHARPISAARAPSTGAPNSTIAAAACGPTARSSIHAWPPPGCRPMRRNRVSKRADSPASRTSQASARFRPAPTAGPFTAATVGSGERRTRRNPS